MSIRELIYENVEKLKVERSITIPVSSETLSPLLNRNKMIRDANVQIKNGTIILTGKVRVKKLLINHDIPFSITLVPREMEKRILVFEVMDVKPFNINFINKQLFNRPPYMRLIKNMIHIDFNNWDVIKKIPIGNITSFEFNGSSFYITVGI